MSNDKQDEQLATKPGESAKHFTTDAVGHIPAANPHLRKPTVTTNDQRHESSAHATFFSPRTRTSGSITDDAASYYDEADQPPRPATPQENAIIRELGGDSDLEKNTIKTQESERPNTTDSATREETKLVEWNNPNDPGNPKNWPSSKKWAATIVVSLFTFISPVSSSMVAPALGNLADDLQIKDEFLVQLTLSIFILAYAVGPLFLGPLSEIYGRVAVLQVSNLVFLAFNIGCAVSRTSAQILVCRFFAGLGGSAPLAIGGGVLSDCFRPEERGKSVAIYSLAPLLGPAVGPIAGGFIAENTSWRWVFYSTTIADAFIQLIGLLLLKETYAPKLLNDKAKLLRRETGDQSYYTEWDLAKKSIAESIDQAMVRPFRLFFTQPIVQVMACFMAYIYGTMYLVLSTFPTLWTSPEYYGESSGIGGLNYVSLALGFWGGTQLTAPLNDRIYHHLKGTYNGVGRPEFRIPLLGLSALLTPAGLFIYGWTAQAHCHWIAPNIGAFVMGTGMIISFQCIQSYMIDTYMRYAASAQAAVTFLRSIAGFAFPIFAPYMYNALSYGWGNSVLAFIALGIGIPAPVFLWIYGESLRKRSTYAAG